MSPDPAVPVKLETRAGVLVARPEAAAIDPGSRSQVIARVVEAMPLHADRVVLDLTGVVGATEHTVPLTLGVLSEVLRQGGLLAVATEDEVWPHVLRLTGLAENIRTLPTVDDAVRTLAPPKAGRPANLLAMISGGGRSVLNLLDAIDRGVLEARLAGVIASSDCAGAAALEARGLGVRVIPGRIARNEFESMLTDAGIDLVILAGYLKMVEVPTGYRNRVLNIHPALLPRHGGKGMHGLNVHRAVLAAGDRESGCTVHFCDDAYDTGRIIVQRRCPVEVGDTPEILAARVFSLECQTYPAAIRGVLESLGFPQPPQR